MSRQDEQYFTKTEFFKDLFFHHLFKIKSFERNFYSWYLPWTWLTLDTICIFIFCRGINRTTRGQKTQITFSASQSSNPSARKVKPLPQSFFKRNKVNVSHEVSIAVSHYVCNYNVDSPISVGLNWPYHFRHHALCFDFLQRRCRGTRE